MGAYLNPGGEGFRRIISGTYIDKTGLLGLINRAIGTTKNLICISRPRRFGKSYAAQMLCAYYDHTCNTEEMFAPYKVAEDESFRRHLNAYHVINLDMSSFVSEARSRGGSLEKIPAAITEALLGEVREIYPELSKYDSLTACLLELVRRTQRKLVFVIDEWDSPIREAGRQHEVLERYLSLLRSWFKNSNFTPAAVAAAYMTGILPIKKDGSQSAISDFQEYSMMEAREYASYVGFTEDEVIRECAKRNRSFPAMRKWYDGYTVGDCTSIYNPYSVMQALEMGKYMSYWKKTSAAETLLTYLDMDQEGLQAEVARLIAGERVVVDTDSFRNDVENFTCRDDVLTLLIHLGYLTYEERADSYDEDEAGDMTGLVRIPNEEVRTEFEKTLRRAKHDSLITLVRKSDKLLQDTLAGKGAEVAAAIQQVHDSEYAPTFYNHEQSLRYVVKMAYISSIEQFAKVEEMPSGHGLADVVFLPKRYSSLPAMVVELKWNKSAEGAIRQIREKGYPDILEKYGGDIVLVGINYDEESKAHSCKIEFVRK